MAERKSTTRKRTPSIKGTCIMQHSEACKKKEGQNSLENFYVATSKMFGSGKLPICKDCMKSYVYDEDGLPNVERFKDILRICDYPFLEAIWETSFNEEGDTIGLYFKNVFLNFKDKTWKDSDGVNVYTDVELGTKGKVTKSNYDDTELTRVWGRGFTTEELHWLEENYKNWDLRTDCSEFTVQKLVRRICITELKIRKAEENNKPVDKLEESLLKLMNSSNLTPKTLKGINENDSQRAFGIWIKDIEKYRPAEYFEDKTLYEDYDGIMGYFNRFVLRPLRNLVAGSRDFDNEYNIEKLPSVGDVDYEPDEDYNEGE